MNPCKDCERRQLGCHGTCPDYKEFRAVIDKAHDARRKELEALEFVLRPVPSKHNRKVKERK